VQSRQDLAQQTETAAIVASFDPHVGGLGIYGAVWLAAARLERRRWWRHDRHRRGAMLHLLKRQGHVIGMLQFPPAHRASNLASDRAEADPHACVEQRQSNRVKRVALGAQSTHFAHIAKQLSFGMAGGPLWFELHRLNLRSPHAVSVDSSAGAWRDDSGRKIID
jgi:hypothetical protein